MRQLIGLLLTIPLGVYALLHDMMPYWHPRYDYLFFVSAGVGIALMGWKDRSQAALGVLCAVTSLVLGLVPLSHSWENAVVITFIVIVIVVCVARWLEKQRTVPQPPA